MSSSDGPPTLARARRRGVVAALLLGALVGVRPHPAGAQGSVRGQLALVQREGADAADLREAVIWLEVRDGAPPPPAAHDGAIVMRDREFAPHVLAVPVGGAVAFPNADPFSHNVFSNAELGPFDLGLYRRGETHRAMFPRPGVYPIYCNIHSKMVSFVVAVPTPWVARPTADGRFALAAVPAGTYVLHAWHERVGNVAARELIVPAAGVGTVRVTLDARGYVSAPHLNKFGRPYAVMRADRY